MTRATQGAILLLFGLALARLGSGDLLLRFVRASARPWVVAGAVGVVVLGLFTLVVDARASGTGDDGHVPVITWLAIAPVLAVMVIGPPALGGYTAAHRHAAAVHADAAALPPLRSRAVVSMQLTEFTIRAITGNGASLQGHVLALTGFVARREPAGFVLARLIITCCAADAAPLFVHVRGTESPPLNSWVRVYGRYAGHDPDHNPALAGVRADAVPEPTSPYE